MSPKGKVLPLRAGAGSWTIHVLVVLCLVVSSTSSVAAFTIGTVRTSTSTGSWSVTGWQAQHRDEVLAGVLSNRCHLSRSGPIRQGTVSNDNESTGTGTASSFNVSLFYGSLWAGFLGFGLFGSPGLVGDPLDMQIIQSYIDNPSAPEGINALFLLIFNGLGVMPLIIAQLACPQGNKIGGVPAAPFLAASMAMGFGAAGLYLTFRSPPISQKTQAEASWFTRTILENKVTSIASLLLLGASVTSALGSVPVPLDASTGSSVLSDYALLASQSKLVSVSSLDLAILTTVAATLIPRDLQLRMGDDESTLALGRNISLATLLFPIIGAALYCLWRPPMPTE